MAKRNADPGEGGNWMDTYGDMVTLLLTFFVALFGMSSVEEDKWLEFVKAFNPSVKEVQQIVIVMEDEGNDIIALPNNSDNHGKEMPDVPVDISILDDILKGEVEESGMGASISVDTGSTSDSQTEDGGGSPLPGYETIYINISNEVLFEGDKSVMLEGSKEIMETLAEILKEYESEIAVLGVKGFTADAESAADSSMLSSERAGRITKYFKDYGIDEDILISLGFGKRFPVASNDTEEGRKKNRRVEISIIPKETFTPEMASQWGSFYSQRGGIEDYLSD
ncbi:MAG: OmpA family protein [Oscillospiraceae bacterium]|jgi:chemotaxis protein MotB|nr:OmpA family protein [Oscillospiraceae bacterium]